MMRPSKKHLIFLLFLFVLMAPTMPHVQGQDNKLSFDFAHYEENPVLTAGERGDWDVGGIYGQSILEHNGTLYMFFAATTQLGPNFLSRIGYATSNDGYHWDKSPTNPVLSGGSLFSHAGSPVVWMQNDRWHLLITEVSATSILPVGRYWHATASNPDGPWSVDDEPMIDTSSNGWDRSIYLNSMVQTEDEYRLYYTGMTRRYQNPQLGLATSPDGVTWTFHDDPSTIDSGFERSDPILTMGQEGAFDSVGVGGTDILATDEGWETIFIGIFDVPTAAPSPDRDFLQFGYATSADGITWTKHEANPIVESVETLWPQSSVFKLDNTYFIYYQVHRPGVPIFDLHLITGTISR